MSEKRNPAGRKGEAEGIFSPQSNELIRAVVEASPLAIIAFDTKARVVMWSPAAERLLGWTESEMIGKPYPVLPEGAHKAFEASFARVLEGGTFNREVRHIHKDGTLLHHRVSAAPIRTQKDTVIGVMATIEDISEQYEMRKAAQEAEERYRTLQENIPVGLFRSTADGRMISVNSANARMYGYDSVDDMLSSRAVDRYVDSSHRESLLKQLKQDGRLVRYVSEQRRKDGSTFWVSSNVTGVFDDKGELLYLDGVDEDYTDRHAAEVALRESEHKNRLVLEHVPSVIAVFRKDGTIVFANRRASTDLGAEPDDLVGATMWDCFPKDIADRQIENIRRVIESGEAKLVEAESVVDGRRKFYLTQILPFEDKAEVTDSAMIIATDITERKEAESARRLSEEFNRAVIEHSPIGVSVRDRFGRLLGYNKSWVGIWEMSRQRLKEELGRHRDRLRLDNHDSYLSDWQDEVKKIYESGGTLKIPELRIGPGPKKTERWISQFFYALNDEAGNVDRVVILTEDITERKQAEIRLQNSQARYRILADHSIDLITRTKPDTTVLYASPASRRLLGYEPEELHGRSGLDFIHEDDRQPVVDRLAELLAKGEPILMEFRVMRKDGDVRWVEASGRPVDHHETGEPVEIVAVHRDITERKETERALLEAHDKLDRRVRERTAQLAEANEALRVEQQSLRQKNIALQELLHQIEDSKRQMATQVQANIDRIVMPYVRALELTITAAGKHYLNLLSENLADITSPFTSSLNSLASALTPRETEICDMIRKGMTSKQIAQTLSTSVLTVNKQRNAIRRKLGLDGKKVNLATYLSKVGVE
jgi:PAS domain S-box-containing protein